MRAFLAVCLPEEVQQEIAACTAQLKSAGADVKWVHAANVHLTVKFLGEIEETHVGQLQQALAEIAPAIAPFHLRVEGIGAFPRTTAPQIIWLGISDGEKELAELVRRVEETCVGLGFGKEMRGFSPHLTIGRVKSREQLAPLIKRLQVAEFRTAGTALVDKLHLFQSVLSPKGPAYLPLAEIPLGLAPR
jgi:2'-5' RNA ligase